MMNIPFHKMHGAGNDFIVIDDRDGSFPIDDQAFLAQAGARRTGVGCDGFILLQTSGKADLRMRFINPDGGEQDMCGNGARCFARRAFDLGVAPASMQIETNAGIVNAEVIGDQVRLQLTDPVDWRFELDVGLIDLVDFVNTGVAHVVARVDDVSVVDVLETGRMIRRHSLFALEGTNVNFVQLEGCGTLSVRTYERGVESETLACGTGIAASALIAARREWVSLPVKVRCAGGDLLEVDAALTEEGAKQVALTGPAVYVYEGILTR